MILTVTPNPALDVTYTLGQLVPNSVLRPSAVHRRAGGKGVNVARVLHAVGQDTVALLPVGTGDGELLRAELVDSGVPHEFVGTGGATRRTTTLLSTVDDTVTLLNEPGSRLSEMEWQELADAVHRLLPSASVLVCSGSLPPESRTDAYAQLIRMATRAGVPSVLDTSGAALLEGVAAGPAVVKPNASELRECTGLDDPLAAARALRARGADAVLVSLGPDGLLACTGEGVWRARPSRPLRGNTTGAGDAAVAGIALELAARSSWPRVLRQAVALSSAAVLGPLAGDVDLEYHRRELRAVAVEEVDLEDGHAAGVNR
ncbi:1-phosphofructokinase [Amycolatopsis antarctica]|uniref:1-phosphofructokinase n=1 Tax=Amycolatopsis antarctica TaxID=1854586 RepID=A0A263CY91_9PSEU|nr:1-phosphofructokinase family hexose kinase [Amycolatopsis antarctica]OZM70949.1 1-phosphofructokinase [Amycolatopsis antarctica]